MEMMTGNIVHFNWSRGVKSFPPIDDDVGVTTIGEPPRNSRNVGRIKTFLRSKHDDGRRRHTLRLRAIIPKEAGVGSELLRDEFSDLSFEWSAVTWVAEADRRHNQLAG